MIGARSSAIVVGAVSTSVLAALIDGSGSIGRPALYVAALFGVVWIIALSLHNRVVERAAEALTLRARGLDSKLAEARAAQAEAEAALHAMSDPLFVLAPGGSIRLVNDAACRVLDYRREDLLGSPLSRVLSEGTGAYAAAACDSGLLRRGPTRDEEVHFVARDGRKLPLSMSTLLIRRGADEPSGLLAVVREIPKPPAISYPSMIAHRTVEGDKPELPAPRALLEHSQKMQAMGMLAGGIAHDFNNMMTVILTHCSLIIRELPISHPTRTDIEQIRDAAQRSAGMTKQLLAFSRRQVLQPKAIDLNDLVNGMIQMLARLVGSEIALSSKLDPTIGGVIADPGQIEQVIMNLVVNARDAMPHGGRITIETRELKLNNPLAHRWGTVPAGRHVMLSVADDGLGMDEGTQKGVFEPFFTTKEIGKGTGLGLSTSHGIIRQSGGSIWLESEPGRGSKFMISFPSAAASAAAEIRDATQGRSSSEVAVGLETILLAEDEASIRNVLARLFRRSGYKVLEAANGAEAIKVAEDYCGTIDVLVTDIRMPEMSGIALAQLLERSRPATPAILMSGQTEDELCNCAAFVQKPFDAETLVKTVRQVLDAREAAFTAMASDRRPASPS